MLYKFAGSPITANVNSSIPVGFIAERALRVLVEEKSFITLFHISMVHASEFHL